jgi:hypothetical protein
VDRKQQPLQVAFWGHTESWVSSGHQSSLARELEWGSLIPEASGSLSASEAWCKGTPYPTRRVAAPQAPLQPLTPGCSLCPPWPTVWLGILSDLCISHGRAGHRQYGGLLFYYFFFQ